MGIYVSVSTGNAVESSLSIYIPLGRKTSLIFLAILAPSFVVGLLIKYNEYLCLIGPAPTHVLRNQSEHHT